MQNENTHHPEPQQPPGTDSLPPLPTESLPVMEPATFGVNQTFTPEVKPPDTHIAQPSAVFEPAPDEPAGKSDEPMPVVKVLSTRGVEYGMMTIALWVAAATTAWVILNMLNGSSGFDSVIVPVSSLVVCLPVFGFFFLRLKRAELAKPSLRLDPSKRRWSQSTQFLAYIVLLVNLIYFVYSLMNKSAGGHSPSIGKSIGNLVVVLVIAGGILAYYWHDEHRRKDI